MHKKLILIIATLGLLATPVGARAANATPDSTGDCVIQDFRSNFTLGSDSSLAVREDITADCGNLSGKHGIFRILPTRAPRTKDQYSETAVHLDSITDETGKSLDFETIGKPVDHTVTWKIGDPSVTITGVHHYVISYTVKNAVESVDSGHVRLYWNLNGAFWQLPINHFEATVALPQGLSQSATSTSLTSGQQGTTTNLLAESHWADNTHLVVNSTQALERGDGITLAMTFPAGIVSLYQPTFWELYQNYLWFLIPLLVFIGMYMLWRRHGHDPRKKGAVMVEYAPPKGLLPMQVAVIDKGGGLENRFITGTIIDFAVRGYLSIAEEVKPKMMGLIKSKDWLLTRTAKPSTDLQKYEQEVLMGVFDSLEPNAESIRLSDLRSRLSVARAEISKEIGADLDARNIFDVRSRNLSLFLTVAGIVLSVALAMISFNFISLYAMAASILTGIIIVIFAALMPRRTPEGAEFAYQIEGFKMYLGKAEKYRMPYYEKENIFEKYLPYAIVFGLTGKWIDAMKAQYGDGYINMLPAWYVFGGGVSSFDSFASNLDSISGQISTATAPVSSGGGSGGFSGGGGGGGGGGSW